MIFQKENTPFQAIKRKSLESRKIDIFPKGLTHCFGPKMAIFPIFFLDNIVQENVFYDILDRKNAFQALKTRSLKSRKIDILRKGLTHGFGPKMVIFSTLFYLGNIGQENAFYGILQRKNDFLGQKNKKFKKSKN